MNAIWRGMAILLLAPLCAHSADWALAKVEPGNGVVPRLTLVSARPITTFGEAGLKGIVTSKPSLPWECLLRNELTMQCQVDYAATMPLATPLLIQVEADRMLDQVGEPLGGAEFSVSTPLPTLLVEPVEEATEQPLFKVVAPLALDPDSIRSSLLATIDDVAVDYQITIAAPPMSSYRYSQPWSVSLGGADGGFLEDWWHAAQAQAWTLKLARLPNSGQLLEFRLKSGLRSEQGPLPGRSRSADGDVLLRFEVPEKLSILASCTSASHGGLAVGTVVDKCSPESPLGLRLNTLLTPDSLRSLTKDFPNGLFLSSRNRGNRRLRTQSGYRELPKLVVPEPMDLALYGASAVSSYRMTIDAGLRGIFGESAEPGQLSWRTRGWSPLAQWTPRRLATRRSESLLPRLQTRGLPETSGEVRFVGLTGAPKMQPFQLSADPNAADPARLELPMMPDRPQWVVATHQSPLQEYQLYMSGEFGNTPAARERMDRNSRRVVVAVTDLGLHAFHQDGQLWALVTDLQSGGPVARAKVQLRNGAAVLAQGRSDANGLVELPGELLVENRELLLSAALSGRGAVISLHDDFVLARYLTQAQESWASNSRRHHNDDGHRARYALFTDKPIYRHGERVHFRLYTQNLQAGRSVDISLVQDDATLHSGQFQLDAFAGVSGEFTLPSSGADWGYAIRIGNQNFDLAVAHHVAPRLQSSLQIADGALVMGDHVPVLVELQRLSGEPLVGQRVELLGKLDDGGWDLLAEHFPGYQFLDLRHRWFGSGPWPNCMLDHSRLYAEFEATDGRGIGRAQLHIPTIPCDFAQGRLAPGPASHLPGSSLGKQTPILIAKRERYLGLGGQEQRWLVSGQRLALQAIAVDVRSLSRLPAVDVRLQIERLGDLPDPDGQASSSAEPELMQECKLTTDGKSQCQWQAASSGRYQVRMSAVGFDDQTFSFVVYEDAVIGYSAGHSNPELRLVKQSWAHGETVRWRLSHRYEQGRVLLVVNNNQGMHELRWFELQRRQQELDWQPPEDLSGAVRASVLIVPAAGPGPLPSVSLLSSHFLINRPPVELIAIESPPLASPGSEVLVRVRSLGTQPLSIAITAYDDALSDLLDHADPQRQIERWWLEQPESQPVVPSLHSVLWSAGGYNPFPPDDDSALTVTVTSAMINPFNQSPETSAELENADRPTWTYADSAKLPDGLRRNFNSRFWWAGDERFAPGESREYKLRLPDDLTRWRIEAVAQAMVGEIQQSSVTLEARQPLVLEVAAPKLLYPGDRTELSAALYCSAADPPALDWQITVASSSAAVAQSIQPRSNEHAELILPFQAQQPGTQLWWTQAASRPGAQALSDGLLSELRVRDPLQNATLRQIGLVSERGLRIDPHGLARQAGPGELTLSVGMDPLFGLSGAVSESLKRRPWLPDNALDQLLTALIAQQMGLAVDPEPYQTAAEALLREHFLEVGWVAFPGGAGQRDRRLSQRIWSRLAALQALGHDVQLSPEADFDWAWEIGRYEYAPRALLQARKLSATRLRGGATEALLDELLRGPRASLEINAHLALTLADSRERQADLSAVLTDLGAALNADRKDAVETRCLALQALVEADQRADSQELQLAVLREIYSSWGSTLPALSAQAVRQCVQSAQAFAQRWLQGQSTSIAVSMGSDSAEGEVGYGLPPLQLARSWSGQSPLPIRIAPPAASLLSYEIAYVRPVDVRTAPSAGKAIEIKRQYRLFRNGRWLEDGATAQVGDWMQVKLQLRSAKSLSYVAVTEPLPGGVVPVDPRLSGALDPRLGDGDDQTWQGRQYGDAENRFLTQYLRGGLTTLTYLARVRFAGDYAWPGPQVELVYAPQVSGRGDAQRLTVSSDVDQGD